ncbi:unnamed protein product [Ambrosiozyma monospora]|uniref:Unnamed protein product n=1 Tax=Ambrosiozyma monospora TaxID=43982 RepID=A0A9W6T1Q4_AMBMO|nr:unnamed protein product [Ambrosiozyma monospora]
MARDSRLLKAVVYSCSLGAACGGVNGAGVGVGVGGCGCGIAVSGGNGGINSSIIIRIMVSGQLSQLHLFITQTSQRSNQQGRQPIESKLG